MKRPNPRVLLKKIYCYKEWFPIYPYYIILRRENSYYYIQLSQSNIQITIFYTQCLAGIRYHNSLSASWIRLFIGYQYHILG